MVVQSLFGILTGCGWDSGFNDIDTCFPTFDPGPPTQ